MGNKFVFVYFTIFSALTVCLSNHVCLSHSQISGTPFDEYWIASTKLLPHSKRSISTCEDTLYIDFGNSSVLKLCVFRSNLSTHKFIDQNSKLHIYKKTGEVSIRQYSDLDYVALNGYVLGKEIKSKVEGHLYKDRFIGRIHTRGRTLYVEELADYVNHLKLKPDPGSDSIIYESVKSTYKCGVSNVSLNRHYANVISNRLVDNGPPVSDYSSRYVKLDVYIDPAFYKLTLGSNKDKTMFAVIHSIQMADKIFRSSDFIGNGKPSNVGIRILNTYFYEEDSFTSSKYQKHLPAFYPFKRMSDIFLHSFANIMSEASDLCILFTGQVFLGNTAGLAYMAFPSHRVTGICAKTEVYPNFLLNKLLVTGSGYESRISQLQLDHTVAHELGHSFGAEHDGDQNTCDNGFIMQSTTSLRISEKLFYFSKCSIPKINALLRVRGSCLTPEFERNICGNGVIDNGEECDCGSAYNCINTKACCYAHDSKIGVPCTKGC